MTPVFCPNPACSHHVHDPQQGLASEQWWEFFGFYMTEVVGPVQRFKCLCCGKTFSVRTFSLDYYTKKSISYKQIYDRVPSGESVSAIARGLRCSVGSVQNRMDRLARNCVAFHEKLLAEHSLSEDLVADGFESFDKSQFFPNNINILVGQKSQMVYASTHVTIRRKGKMTKIQRKRRETYEQEWKAPVQGIETSFAGLLAAIVPLWDSAKKSELALITDEHFAYPRGIGHIPELVQATESGSFKHRRYSSKLVRTVDNPLFPVNYLDRELRKDIPAYHRESTCFCRNTANGRMRFAIYQAWHNYTKPHRIRNTREQSPVHAVVAGLDESRIKEAFSDFFTQRAFLSKSRPSEEGRKVWLKGSKTPLKRRSEYIPKYQYHEQQAL